VNVSKFSVGFASQDWSKVGELLIPNGCTWYRCVLPLKELQKFGHGAVVGTVASSSSGEIGIGIRKPLYSQEGTASGLNIIVFKLAMHISNLTAIEKAESSGQKIVVDIDDWFDGLPESNRAFETTNPETNKENNRDIYFSVINRAHALICSTPFLYEQYKLKYPSKPIFMVRNGIDLGRWKKKKHFYKKPVIGWVGATPWRGNDLEQLSGFFGDYLLRNKLTFHHSGHIDGAQKASELIGAPSDKSTTQGMIPILNLPELFKKIDIGIVPLNNIPFNHAKSYLKGLEYAAAGIPFVASYSPEYEVLAQSGIGRVAYSESDWLYHFDELLNHNMRNDEAEVSQEILKEQFSMDVIAKEWENVFMNIMDIK